VNENENIINETQDKLLVMRLKKLEYGFFRVSIMKGKGTEMD